jgi:hypothetical protein
MQLFLTPDVEIAPVALVLAWCGGGVGWVLEVDMGYHVPPLACVGSGGFPASRTNKHSLNAV